MDKTTIQKIPLLTIKASPRDKDKWIGRLKEEYTAIIKATTNKHENHPINPPLLTLQYIQMNQEQGNDWFKIESNKEGTRWWGKCWHIHNLLKYEFDFEFDVRTHAVRVQARFY